MSDILNAGVRLVTRMAAQLNHAIPGASTVLAWAVGGLVGLVVVLILSGATLRFLRWAVAALLSGVVQAFWGVAAFIGMAARWLADALQRATVFAVSKSWQGIGAGARFAFAALRGTLRPTPGAAWRHEPSFATGATGATGAMGAADDLDESGGGAALSAIYAAALDLLGLGEVTPLTRDAVKRRHAAMLRGLAAQQSAAALALTPEVNAALKTILRAHGWR